MQAEVTCLLESVTLGEHGKPQASHEKTRMTDYSRELIQEKSIGGGI